MDRRSFHGHECLRILKSNGESRVRIARLLVHAVRIPVLPARRMLTALGAHNESRYLLTQLVADDGTEGIGEATVMPTWSGETTRGAKAMLEEVLGPAVMGADPSDVEEVSRRMDAAARHNWFAKAAIEMACWDLSGKRENQPVHRLLGGPVRGLETRCRFSMGAYPPDRAGELASELVRDGFRTIKVKVGGDPALDLARVRAVREAAGPEIEITIDANCGWDAETAIAAVNAIDRECGIVLNEQPTPDGDYGALARVRRETRPPVMADDMCFDMVHARELIRNEACDLIAVYPGKNGGILKSKRLAEYAASRGVRSSIGSNLEWDVATAAMAHLVTACPELDVERFPGDMLGPIYHEARVVRNPIDIRGPMVRTPEGPGLGVEIDWEVVEHYRMRD